MCGSSLIVLKFGGSVLTDESTLRMAVHEIYRWRRHGHRVVAVVSALAGVTDELFRRCRRIGGQPDSSTVASVVSNGEMQSAALLGLHLDRAGVPATVLAPAALHFVAEGPLLDSTPVALCAEPIERALDRDGVVVVPGFIAHQADGRTCLLGRGGSDLTALFLSHCLKAKRCRLVKDVDGLYERDPSQPGPKPRRYATASWSDALATDGSIVQHKAVQFAAAHAIEFELGRINGCNPTRIGRRPAAFESQSEPIRPLRTAILGLGVVGGGVFELLRQLHPLVDITNVLVRDPDRQRSMKHVTAELLTTDPAAAIDGAELVIELIGGVDVADKAVTAALRSGSHVVTANKALLAQHGDRLRTLAASRGRLLRYSAAVGGSMPLLERLAAQADRGVRSILAILNGTTNFIIERVAAGVDFGEAVKEAQAAGFAEADPSRDLSGQDAADKLTVVADAIGAATVAADRVRREPLGAETVASAIRSKINGEVFRHVASLDYARGEVTATVSLRRVEADDPLAAVHAEHNAAVIEWRDGEKESVRGKGAGRWPTAEAVVADVLEIVRRTSPA